MRICLLGLSLVLMAGCCGNPPDLEPKGPTAYLADLDPSSVAPANFLAKARLLTDHYWDEAQVLGVAWEPKRSSHDEDEPDTYGNGGDAALFTGYALAAFTFEWATTRDAAALARAAESLRGLRLLTRVAGRGVIARCAFPVGDAALWSWPQNWARRISEGFVGRSNQIKAPWNEDYPPCVFYTRATKDQLTGIVFGLSVAWKLLESPVYKRVITEITEDLYDHLRLYGWFIRDARGKNDTGADHVTGLLRTQLLALYKASARASLAEEARELYEESFKVRGAGDLFNTFNNYQQYFAHNLRAARAFSVWILEEDEEKRAELEGYVEDNVWRHVEGHQNGWLALLHASMSRDEDAAAEGRLALASLALKPVKLLPSPYAGQGGAPQPWDVVLGCDDLWVVSPHLRKPTGYFTWTKRPWDVGKRPSGTRAPGDTTGLDYLLPYWLGRFYGLIKEG